MDKVKLEKEIQDYYMGILQKYAIDFIRIPNQATMGKFKSHSSKAVFDESKDQNCLKNFPDVMFCFMGKVYQREFSLKIGNKYANSDRKEKQQKRMQHWHENGNVDILIVSNLQLAKIDIENILGDKSLEVV